ncbi:unnamed protein product [Haemonchus placei]|uniref:Uncharacterized protein n=1 Tax=Haemonchus placei TaxID=6290 RepID=A0A0N4X855_HAEPC|nr:unnamed protein product [Haemonchus placei]
MLKPRVGKGESLPKEMFADSAPFSVPSSVQHWRRAAPP